MDLLYGSGQIGERFDKFLKNTWGLGPAAVSEILCFIEPRKYAMWNGKVGNAIEKLGLGEKFRNTLGIREKTPLPKVQMSGKRYERFLDFMDGLRRKLETVFGRATDFLELDFFLYYVAKGPKPPPKLGETLKSHAEAQYYLLALGRLLGYPTYAAKHDRAKYAFGKMLGEVADETELPSTLRGLRGIRNPEDVDVMWLDEMRKRPIYAFEVSHTTDVTKDAAALKDLWMLKKGFIVIPDYRKKEFEKLRYSSTVGDVIHKGKLGVITYSQLLELYKKGQAFIGLLNEIGIKLCEY